LLKELNTRLGLTILLITHQIDVVKAICDSVAVMQAGQIIEQGPVVDVMARTGSWWHEFSPSGREVRPDSVLVNITFVGEAADQPVLTRLARKFDIDANILGGTIETIKDRRIGRLQVELTGDQQKLSPALKYLNEQGLQLEVVG
jgi:D-methionine transport system ATP-binding protein